jgi:23S rRNA pseudouridine2457 synthase
MILVAYTYVVLHKPYGVVTQFSGENGLSTFVSMKGIYPVGRLDKDSEGLLLLTDDGPLQHRLSHPKFEHQKTYWAQVEGVPTEAALASLRNGVRVEDYVTRPAKVRRLESVDVPARVPPIRYRPSIPDSWIEIVLTEGRNRQVRKMCAAVGFPVLRLIRVAIGTITLEGLKPGEWRKVSDRVVKHLL